MSPGSSYKSEEFEYDDNTGFDYQSGSRSMRPHPAPRPQNMPTRKNGKVRALRKGQRKSKNKPAACQTGMQRRRDKRWNW